LDTVVQVLDTGTGQVTNLGVAPFAVEPLAGGGLAVQVDEHRQGRDLNGDGDTFDFVLMTWTPAGGLTNLRTATVQGSLRALDGGAVTFLLPDPNLVHDRYNGDPNNYGTVAVWTPGSGVRSLGVVTESTGTPFVQGAMVPLAGGGLAVTVSEARQGADLNGDGDTTDEVIHVWTPAGGLVNLRLASSLAVGTDRHGPYFTALPDGGTALLVSEAHQGGRDLNGDGDHSDDVVEVWRPGIGVTNLGVAADTFPTDSVRGAADGRLPFLALERDQSGQDLNGDGDAADRVYEVWTPNGGVRNLGVAGLALWVVDDGSLAFDVPEADQGGQDLTGDGDASDNVLFVLRSDGRLVDSRLANDAVFVTDAGRVAYRTMEWYSGPDQNGDGDDTDGAGGVYDPAGDTVVNFGVAVVWTVWPLGGGRYAVLVDEAMQGGRDLNGDGDAKDKVMEIVTVAVPPGGGSPPPVQPPIIPPPVPPLGPGAPGDTSIPVTSAGSRTISGYWMVAANGDVYAFGAAGLLGSPSLTGARAVDIEPTPGGRGYWVLDSVGNVRAYGDAVRFGGVTPATLAPGEEPTSLSATPSGAGYWIFTSRGRVLPFGDAAFHGDMSNVALNGKVLGSVATPSGRGYYMVAADGGIFTFGDAVFHGSTGSLHLNRPVMGMAPAADGSGYWLVAADGGIFAFGVPFRGSMGGTRLNQPITGLVPGADGYLMVAADGGIFSFGTVPFFGSLGSHPPASPVVAAALQTAR
ncbi:MAG: hypothetical protein LC792_21255, partial [Actinobacteria bacterium]|nr:hypothetical protein [Actinomycetota bacterium]